MSLNESEFQSKAPRITPASELDPTNSHTAVSQFSAERSFLCAFANDGVVA
jgi:hypothetical protein